MLTKRLTFSAVDELGFAAARGLIDPASLFTRYLPQRLGPLLELVFLAEARYIPVGLMQTSLVPNGASEFVDALQGGRDHWLSPDQKRAGFIRSERTSPHGDTLFTSFLMAAKRAAQDISRVPGTTAGQLVAAMQEMENNIHEHSDAPATGVLAFRAAQGTFEFVAADRGIGILNSLRKSDLFSGLSDDGAALRWALQDGTSRFGPDSKRGHGFRPIFLGLVNLRGELRFRSGDHALLIDGTSPELATAQLAQKPVIHGFFASVRCEISVPKPAS